MAKQLRVGIVGLGIGRVNGRAIHANRRGRVVALCDLIESRMDEFETELGHPVRKYTDYKKMCRDAEIDAVLSMVPNQLHVPVALEAIRHGKHVLVTKPLADSEAAARRVVSAAEKAGVVNMMSLSLRFSDPVRRLGAMTRQGRFGELYYARARSVRRSGIPAWNLGFVQKGGGAFRDMGVHVLDSAWWLMGCPRPITVSGVAGAKFGPRGLGYWNFGPPQEKSAPKKYAADDYAGGFVRFENDAGLQVESFWASHQPEELQVEVFGTEAGARLHPLTIYRTEDSAGQDVTVKMPSGPSEWDRIADHFIACCLDGTKCQSPLRHGMIVQQMMEGLLRSAVLKREVRITN
jgi:predicted dehydrogenase